jgi:hypothetical protein
MRRRLFSNGQIGPDRPWSERYGEERQNKTHVVNVNRFHRISPSPVFGFKL